MELNEEKNELQGIVVSDSQLAKEQMNEFEEKRLLFEEKLKLENVWGYGLK